MKKIFISAILFLLFMAPGYSQTEKQDSVGVISPPAVYTDDEIIIPDFSLYRQLYFPETELPANIDSNSIWLWTSYAISSRNRNDFLSGNTSPHMLANFHEQYMQNSKFNIVRTVLGMAQLGAVGYLAYKSIKKHGFWDLK